ncbi:hypothetical protein QTJ16_006181 [Diplocarpon rosae]|uniref:Uncharacterized protein n=1 Tax=Diplocarpon rosae TaxID=946125 RepID=A0AAD9SUZ0_9HELO|nr:hypothetical protein QTJ16_006181 [Diplocarpon rosae]PBP23929.1 hypothetical protein BUE80_DR005046 [Diplocarpon rosae]
MGGRTRLLNETCVAVLTVGYRNFTSIDHTLAAQCAYHEPDHSYRRGWQTFAIILVTSLITAASVGIYCGGPGIRRSMITRLREVPSHRLHRELEDVYEKYCVKLMSKQDRQDWEQAGKRYMTINCVEDDVALLRTVTIVEDLRLSPLPGNTSHNKRIWREAYGGRAAELQDMSVAARTAAAAAAAGPYVPPPRPMVSPVVASYFGNAAPALAVPNPAATRNEDNQAVSGARTADSGPPPPYKHQQWQNVG